LLFAPASRARILRPFYRAAAILYAFFTRCNLIVPLAYPRGKVDFHQLAISAPAWIGPVQTARRSTMDLLYIGLIAAFVAVSIALVYGFDKLKERP
jgi:hypothetical protein